MKNKDNSIAAEWFKYARRDLDRVQRRIDEGDLADAVFHLQQAAEKVIKAALIGSEWKLQRTHDLAFLCDELTAKGIDLVQYRSTLNALTQLYSVNRYPMADEPLPDKKTVIEYYENVKSVFQAISSHKKWIKEQ